MRRLWCGLFGLWVAAACGGGADTPDTSAGEPATTEAPSGPDPCTLVSQQEMETFIGPLAEPPFRVHWSRSPDPGGEGCFYRAQDGRNLSLLVDWEDGETAFRMLVGLGTQIEEILRGYDAATDTLDGTWDQIGYAVGQLMVLKGSTSVQVDPFGSRIGLQEAVAIAAIATRRIDSPLRYDGSAATRNRRDTARRDRDPCSLVTRDEVEALMGPLAEPPRPSDDPEGCAFVTPIEVAGERLVRVLEVQWTDGFYRLGQERSAWAGTARIAETQLGDAGIAPENTAGGTDWDDEMRVMGGEITVVKRDVFLRVIGDGMNGFDEARALQLLRLAVARI